MASARPDATCDAGSMQARQRARRGFPVAASGCSCPFPPARVSGARRGLPAAVSGPPHPGSSRRPLP
eukprot:11164302-Lingulodinium_polyedra.AAC.1